MNATDWPNNWPPLDTLRAILRTHPNGCRKGDFEHLNDKRPAGIIAINGMSWINIRKRLLSDGVADLLADGSLVLAGKQPAARQAPIGGGFSAEQITAALAELWAENDAGDPAEIIAQVLAKLGALPASLAEIAEPDPEPEGPPPLTPAQLSARWQPLFERLLGLLPTTEAEAVTPAELRNRLEASGWEMVEPDMEMVHAMFGPNARDQRNEIRTCGGPSPTKRLSHSARAWRDPNPKPLPEPQPHRPSGINPFAPKPPETEEEREARREKRERIERNLDPTDLCEVD